MDAEEIIKNDKYYEKDSYNVFDTFSIHGLNIEGIKRYYSKQRFFTGLILVASCKIPG